MHLMVLGASRPCSNEGTVPRNTVSMHLMVLGASRPCSNEGTVPRNTVSMHLMVLGASRLHYHHPYRHFRHPCLNAPDGAGCSLTGRSGRGKTTAVQRLNAPDGAGCSLTEDLMSKAASVKPVLMHLMVLGAP